MDQNGNPAREKVDASCCACWHASRCHVFPRDIPSLGPCSLGSVLYLSKLDCCMFTWSPLVCPAPSVMMLFIPPPPLVLTDCTPTGACHQTVGWSHVEHKVETDTRLDIRALRIRCRGAWTCKWAAGTARPGLPAAKTSLCSTPLVLPLSKKRAAPMGAAHHHTYRNLLHQTPFFHLSRCAGPAKE